MSYRLVGLIDSDFFSVSDSMSMISSACVNDPEDGFATGQLPAPKGTGLNVSTYLPYGKHSNLLLRHVDCCPLGEYRVL